jgi:hypothetical protein
MRRPATRRPEPRARAERGASVRLRPSATSHALPRPPADAGSRSFSAVPNKIARCCRIDLAAAVELAAETVQTAPTDLRRAGPGAKRASQRRFPARSPRRSRPPPRTFSAGPKSREIATPMGGWPRGPGCAPTAARHHPVLRRLGSARPKRAERPPRSEPGDPRVSQRILRQFLLRCRTPLPQPRSPRPRPTLRP